MQEVMSTLLLLGFALVITSLPFNAVMLLLLRRDHPQVFEEIGEPQTLGLGARHHGNANYARFLLLRGHRALGDARISRLADIQLLLIVASVAAIGLTLLLALLRQG